MSQSDRTELSPRPAASAPAARPAPAAPAVAAAVAPVAPPRPGRSAAEIERDIEATRERLATSIDELADRVHPKAVAQRTADKAKLTVIDEQGAPRTGRLAGIGAAVAAVAGIVLWRRRG